MGRLVFASSPTGQATATTQTKYASAADVCVKMRIDAASIRNIPNYTTVAAVTFADKDDLQFRIVRQDTNEYALALYCTSQGQFTAMSYRALSALPANGNDVVLYWQCIFDAGNPTLLLEVYDGSGTLIETSTHNSVFRPSGFTNAGTGALRVWNVAQALDAAGLAIYSAVLTGSGKSNKPLSADSNVLGVYYFAEGTGSSTADATGGTSLTVSNGTLNSTSDAWDDAPAVAKSVFPFFLR